MSKKTATATIRMNDNQLATLERALHVQLLAAVPAAYVVGSDVTDPREVMGSAALTVEQRGVCSLIDEHADLVDVLAAARDSIAAQGNAKPSQAPRKVA